MNWGKRCLCLAALALGGWSFHVWAAGQYIGEIDLVEQYAGPSFSTAMCFVGVPAQAVQSKPTCASGGPKYYFAWECDDLKRKGMLAIALGASMSGKRVQPPPPKRRTSTTTSSPARTALRSSSSRTHESLPERCGVWRNAHVPLLRKPPCGTAQRSNTVDR